MADKYAQWVRGGQFVEARYAYGRDGIGVHARGKVVAYCDAPTVTIQAEDGTLVHWRADLTTAVDAPDDPRKDEPGTVRVSPGGAQYVKVETREGVEPWVFLRGGSGASTQFVRMPDGGVVGWPYAAPVTVTPAAEAAVTAERSAGCQNHWPADTEQQRRPVPLSEIVPPRLFKANRETGAVEEPPAWVAKVVDNQGDELRREDDGWSGYGGDGYPLIVKPWDDHVLAKYAPYKEVS